MAYVNMLYYICLFLLLNGHNGGPPGLGVIAENLNSTTNLPENHLENERTTLGKNMAQDPGFKCYECETANCDEDRTKVCHNSRWCYKVVTLGSDGSLRHSRGCSYHKFSCASQPQPPSLRKRRPSFLNITCCLGDLCNAGEFPSLPEETVVKPLD